MPFIRIGFVILLILCLLCRSNAKTNSYRCLWQGDPSSSIIIGWNQISGTNPRILLDTLAINDDISASTKIYEATSTNSYKRMKNCFVELTHLLPGKTYYFIIEDSDSRSRRMSFRTLPLNYDKLSIIAGGDSRNHRESRKNANRLVAKLRPDFVLFAGDMTGADNARSWKKWMEDWQLTIGKDGRLTPIVVARGNHERSNMVLSKLFNLKNENNFYSLNFGSDFLKVITLNSLISPNGKQGEWLEKELMDSDDFYWKIVQYHHPMRPHTYKKTEKYLQQKYWAPLFYNYEVDLAIECDAHVVKTTYPIRPSKETDSDEGFIRDDENGTVYIGEGCWGAPLRKNNDNKNWTRASGSFNQFKWIFLSQNKMEIRTIKTDNEHEVGRLYDENKFDFPSNLDIWKPETGSVVVIEKDNNDMGQKENLEKMIMADLPPISMDSNQKKQGWKLTVFFFLPLLLFMIFPFLPNFNQIKMFLIEKNLLEK